MLISFIELDFHHDVVDGFCRTFTNTDIKVDFYIRKKVFDKLKKYDYLKADNFNWIIFEKGSRSAFLKTNIAQINKANCVFINTLSTEPFAYFGIKFEPKVILRVHNVNKLFNPLSHIKVSFKLFFLWKAFSYFIREVLWGKYLFAYRKIQQIPDYFTFPDQAIARYAISKGYIKASQLAPSFSLKVYENPLFEKNTPNENKFEITIIGGVDKRRRDYESVIKAIELSIPKLIESFTLTLLGNCATAYGQEVVQRLKNLENDKFKLKYFNQIVPQDDFDAVISNTNIILSPINVDTIVEIYSETYGQTKVSGSIYDSIRFPKFTILPASYQLDPQQKEYFETYDSVQSLSELLVYNINHPNIVITKTNKYVEFVKNTYSVQKVRTDFVKFINKIQN